MGGVYFAAGLIAKAGEILFKLIGSQQNQQNTITEGGKRSSFVSADALDKAIDSIGHDLEQWSIAESKSEADSLQENSAAEDPEVVQRRLEEENQFIVKIERIVERSIMLYNSSLFMPQQPAPEKGQKLKNANKAEPPLALSAPALQQNLQQSQRLQQLAMDSLKMFVRKLRKRRSLAYDDRQYDAFERVPWNMCPDLLSNDLYMYPAVCWAILLQANAERFLQDSVQFSHGLKIQRGDVVLSTEDYQEQLDSMEAFFSKAIQVIEAARFHGGYEAVDEESPGKGGRRNRSVIGKNSAYGDEDAIKSAAADLATSLGGPSPTKSVLVAPPSKDSPTVEPKTRHGSTISRPSKRGSAAITRRGTATTGAKAATGAQSNEEKAAEEEETPSDPTTETDATTVITKMTSMDMHLADTIDTSLLKDVYLNVKQLVSMDNDMRTNRFVMSTANKSLVRQGVTEFNPWTGQLGSTMLPSIFPTTNTGVKTEERPSNAVGQIRDPEGATDSTNKKGVQVAYKPKHDDPLSLRSEMVPTKSTFGIDEASSWIQWALGAVGGISLGFLGHSCMSADELIACVTADNEPKKSKVDSLNETSSTNGPRLSEAFLIEIRNRLLEVDTKLTLTDEIDVTGEEDMAVTEPTVGGEGDATATETGTTDVTTTAETTSTKKKRRGDHLLTLPNGQLETRILLLFVLVKVTAELHWKKELLPSLLQLEKTFEILRQRYGASIAYRYELLIYGTMIQKFRLEYDQWLLLSSDVMSDGERAEVLMLQILPRAKKYYQTAVEMMTIMQAVNSNPLDPMARDNGQMYLLKDAVRRLTNVYIGVGNIPVKIQPPTQNASYGKKKPPTNEPPPQPTIQPPGTLEELERFSEKEVEDKEKNDLKWLQKFGRARAQAVYKKFKTEFGGKTLSPPRSASIRPDSAIAAAAATVKVSF